jgi:hypothetical protein
MDNKPTKHRRIDPRMAPNGHHTTMYIKINSQMILVPMKNGTFRVKQDIRELKAASHYKWYSMKRVHECIGDIGRAGSTRFLTLDKTHGFWLMPL